MVTEAVQKDKEAEEKEVTLAQESDANLPTSDDEEEDEEIGSAEEDGSTRPVNVKRQAKYEAWRVRELKRILRDREEAEVYEKE